MKCMIYGYPWCCAFTTKSNLSFDSACYNLVNSTSLDSNFSRFSLPPINLSSQSCFPRSCPIEKRHLRVYLFRVIKQRFVYYHDFTVGSGFCPCLTTGANLLGVLGPRRPQQINALIMPGFWATFFCFPHFFASLTQAFNFLLWFIAWDWFVWKICHSIMYFYTYLQMHVCSSFWIHDFLMVLIIFWTKCW